jgi:uncharacterized membrane protein
MRRIRLSIVGSSRAVVAAGWFAVCLCALAAPILASQARFAPASVLYFLFAHICHQIPERSFHLLGYSLAVCHRCFGIYLGLFLGCFADIPRMHRSPRHRRLWVLGAIAPLALDALAPVAGLWVNSALSRFSTGMLFGTLISSLVVRGFAEFAREALLRRPAVPFPPFKGDLVCMKKDCLNPR